MRKRTEARENALKALYEIDVTKNGANECLFDIWSLSQEVSEESKNFTIFLVNGVSANIKEIDDSIIDAALNWDIKRMAVIDRNILRLCCFELLYCKDIPVKVSINEAVELAKKFGDNESWRFVNGVLDKINKTHCTSKALL